MESRALLKEICIITSPPNDVVVEESHELNRLSFSNYLPDQNCKDDVSNTVDSPHSAQIEDTFEFFTNTTSINNPHSRGDAIAKIHEDQRRLNKNEYQKRDYFANNPKPCNNFDNPHKSDGHWGFRSLSLRVRSASDVGRQRAVNFSSLTSMSSKSRRRMFMFGPVKFKPEMEIAAIRQRQRAEPPRAVDGAGGGRRWSSASWQLTRVLGCMPVMTTGGFQF